MAECLHRELGDRYRRFSPRVRDGKMTAAESAKEIAEMRAARNLLRILAECDQDALRSFLMADREMRRALEQKDEVDNLLETDAYARQVVSAFPNSTVLLNERKPVEYTGEEFLGAGSADDSDIFPYDRRAVEGPAP